MELDKVTSAMQHTQPNWLHICIYKLYSVIIKKICFDGVFNIFRIYTCFTK